MIESGIIRKIDLLGRIVIPKEIRKSLKIDSGDDIEMFVDSGSIILKKFHAMDNYTELAKSYCNTIYDNLHINCFICSKEKIIAATFNYSNDYISNALAKLIAKSGNIVLNNENVISLIDGDDSSKYKSQCISPVNCMGDLYGAVVTFNSRKIIDEKEIEFIYNASMFLCGQIS